MVSIFYFYHISKGVLWKSYQHIFHIFYQSMHCIFCFSIDVQLFKRKTIFFWDWICIIKFKSKIEQQTWRESFFFIESMNGFAIYCISRGNEMVKQTLENLSNIFINVNWAEFPFRYQTLYMCNPRYVGRQTDINTKRNWNFLSISEQWLVSIKRWGCKREGSFRHYKSNIHLV